MINLETIDSRDDRYFRLIASLAYAAQPFVEIPQPEVTFTFTANVATRLYFCDAVTAVTSTSAKPNLIRETLVRQIDRLSDDPNAYEDGERAPDEATKNSAKDLISGLYPTTLLSGADVYAFYGEINISWESQQRKVKLIVPPHDSNQPLAVYHGRMEHGRVVESALEPMATGRNLAAWLIWLQG